MRSRVALMVTAAFGFASASLTLAVTAPSSWAAGGPTYSLANVGAFGGEPSIASNRHGELYDTTPSQPD